MMKVLMFIFIKVPCKVFRIILYKWEYWYYRFFYTKPELNVNFVSKRYLIAGGDNFDSIARRYRELYPNKVKDKIKEADLICENIFDLLGSGPKRLGREDGSIDWHSDFKSGYRWNSKTFYRNIRFGHIEGVDIKVPWELSRFQHLNTLGQAYTLTKSKKYSEEFANQITDWMKDNPVGFGINWRNTMDVAIRAANWLVAQEYFSDKNIFSKEFWQEFYTSIYEHGKFIRNHLEYSPNFTNNHYLVDIAGLFFISVYCPFFKESKKWQEFTLQELSKEMEKQVYSDGCNFEASTSYHRLALELFFYTELLGKQVGVEFPERYKKVVQKMFAFSFYCIKPNGMFPQIGDNDNGRFLKFSPRPILEHKYLLGLAAIYFKDGNFKLSQLSLEEEPFWLFGEDAKTIWDNLSFRESAFRTKSFPDAGWYIIRHKNDYCFVSCGPSGQGGRGGHAHNDKLSFELMLDGQDIFVDPGTYVYTPHPKERNKFRSTGYHNTIKFNGYEQNEISGKDIFSLADRVKIENVDLKETDDKIAFQGEIQYSGSTHKRTITLDKQSDSWLIKDSFSCKKPLNAKLIFHLSPDVIYTNGFIFSKKTNKKIASIKVENCEIKKEEYEYSPEYGIKIKAECLTANIPIVEDNQTITTYIRGA